MLKKMKKLIKKIHFVVYYNGCFVVVFTISSTMNGQTRDLMQIGFVDAHLCNRFDVVVPEPFMPYGAVDYYKNSALWKRVPQKEAFKAMPWLRRMYKAKKNHS